MTTLHGRRSRSRRGFETVAPAGAGDDAEARIPTPRLAKRAAGAKVDRVMLKRPLLLVVLLGLLAEFAEARHPRSINVPGRGRLTVEVPAGYSFETERDPRGAVLVRMENPVWRIRTVALVVAEDDLENTTRTWQENRLITFMADTLSQAAERDYNFSPLNPSTGTGVKMIFTDPRVVKGEPLPPEEYANLTGGVRAWRGVTIIFQVLSMDITSEEYREMMRVFTHGFERG